MSDIIEIEEVSVEVVQTVEEVTVEQVTETIVVESSFAVAPATGYAQRVEQVSATVCYVGEAGPGSTAAEAAWRIRKVEEFAGGLTVVSWAGSEATFDRVWDDRATYTYG